MKNKITKILAHDVSWSVESKSVKELDDTSIEHIEECIKDGMAQGDLHVCYGKNMQRETPGWWHIINWRDIACELLHACPGDTDRQKAAVERFNREWTF